MESPHYSVFVYGSLKRGFALHHLLQGQQFVANAETLPFYRLYDLGSYPGLTESAPGLAIAGEVYRVSAECLQQLDEAEGVAEGLYARRPVRLRDDPGHGETLAWFYLGLTCGLPDCGYVWPSFGSGFRKMETC